MRLEANQRHSAELSICALMRFQRSCPVHPAAGDTKQSCRAACAQDSTATAPPAAIVSSIPTLFIKNQ